MVLQDGDSARIGATLNALTPTERARAIARLGEDSRGLLFQRLSPGDASALIQDLPRTQAVEIINALDAVLAAKIVSRLPDDERTDMLGAIPRRQAGSILRKMDPRTAAQTKRLMAYPHNAGGGLMTTDVLAFPQSWTAREAIDELRRNRDRYARYDVQYVYVVSRGRRLSGVLRLRDLLLAPARMRLRDCMVREIVSVRADESLDAFYPLFHEKRFMGLPVVDHRDRLVGVVTHERAVEAAGDQDRKQLLKMSGILGGEEFRSMPLGRRMARRLSWLSLNVILNVLAASVIAVHQQTLSAAVVLAVFLPIISDMSGCSGNQAVAVSIRELSLGLARPADLLRILGQEIGIGLVNGAVLGFLIGAVALVWKGNAYLGLVVGSALAINTLLSVCLGGILPLVLRRMRMDPALASGPILTTITDMAGFFFVLRFAGALLPRITG